MSYFDGSTSSKKREVNLGGKSLKKSGAVVETKEQLAERNAKARLQREHHRAENSAALSVSLSWRAWRARSVTKTRIQEIVEVALDDCLHCASSLSPNDLGPPALPILDRTVRALSRCFNLYMFLRKDQNHTFRTAFNTHFQRLLDALSSNLTILFAFDGHSGVQVEVLMAILERVSSFELCRVLRAVGSDVLVTAARDNSCPLAASAIKLLSVPTWSCLNVGHASAVSNSQHLAHHSAVAILLCATCADSLHRGNGPLLQLLVSYCITSTHAVQTAADAISLKCDEGSRLVQSVVDAWQNRLLPAANLVNSCPSVFHPQHPHSAQVWSQLLKSMMSSPVHLSDTALNNIMSISAVFKEQRPACRLVANSPGILRDAISRDVALFFIREMCPESMSDLSTNSAAFTSWLKALSPAELDCNQEMTRLFCNVVAPILRASHFSKALPILNLCAFEIPIPALLLAQTEVRSPAPPFVNQVLKITLSTGSSVADIQCSSVECHHGRLQRCQRLRCQSNICHVQALGTLLLLKLTEHTSCSAHSCSTHLIFFEINFCLFSYSRSLRHTCS
jgi:hypothetical protein